MTRHCLIEAMRSLGVNVEEQLLFPATLTLSELLGRSQGSNETYGLLGRIMRRGFRQHAVNGELSEWTGTSLEVVDPDSPFALRGRVQHGSKDGDIRATPTNEGSFAGGPAFEVETDEDGNPKQLAAERSNTLSAFVKTEPLNPEDSKVVKESTPLLVLDGPLSGEMPGILLPLLTGGQLCHSGEGGSLHSVEGLQVSPVQPAIDRSQPKSGVAVPQQLSSDVGFPTAGGMGDRLPGGTQSGGRRVRRHGPHGRASPRAAEGGSDPDSE